MQVPADMLPMDAPPGQFAGHFEVTLGESPDSLPAT